MHVPEKLNRPVVLDLIGVATLAVVVLVLFLAAITLPAAVTAGSNSESARRSDTLTACRSEYRAAIDDANIALEKARTRGDLLTSEGLQAAVSEDREALAKVLAQGPGARLAIAQATMQLDAATARYQRAVTESRLHPKTFLERCKAGD